MPGSYGCVLFAGERPRATFEPRAVILGASRLELTGLVVREGLGATAGGLAIGLVLASAGTRLMRSALFGVAPLDPIAFIAAPLILLPVALLACAIPARRAAAADPAEALRCE